MSEFRSYSGPEFRALQFPKRDFLVQKILREKDSVMFVGGDKAGKSVFMFQLICSLTSGRSLLDQFDVSRPCRVSYIQLEGEISDYHDRFMRMESSLEIDWDMLHYKYTQPLNITDKACANSLCAEIKEYHKGSVPDVIILDPLYFCLGGSLSDDVVVRQFLGNIRVIKDHFGCAVVIVHHPHRIKRDKGRVINEGDDAIFGSAFFKAWADHVFLMKYDAVSKLRTLTCGTQRSGDILEEAQLRLVQPNPLYFELLSFEPIRHQELLGFIQIYKSVTAEQAITGIPIPKSSFYLSVKYLLNQKLVKKSDGTRPIFYSPFS